MALDFDQPIKLRSEDRPDPMLVLIDLHEVLRHLLDEAVQARDLMSRPPLHDMQRHHARVHGRLVDIAETAGLASDGMDRLTRALRAAGRL